MKSVLIIFIFMLTIPINSEDFKIAGSGNITSLQGYRVLKEAYSRIGINTQFKELPAERSLVETSNGHYDGESIRISGLEDKYPGLIMIPIPIVTLEVVVVSKNTAIEIEGWHSLKPYTIVYKIGSKLIENNTVGMDTYAVSNFQNIIPMLESNRADLGLLSREQAISEIAYRNSKTIKILSPVLHKTELYHYIHVSNRHLAENITKVLKEMYESGEIKLLNDEG